MLKNIPRNKINFFEIFGNSQAVSGGIGKINFNSDLILEGAKIVTCGGANLKNAKGGQRLLRVEGKS